MKITVQSLWQLLDTKKGDYIPSKLSTKNYRKVVSMIERPEKKFEDPRCRTILLYELKF